MKVLLTSSDFALIGMKTFWEAETLNKVNQMTAPIVQIWMLSWNKLLFWEPWAHKRVHLELTSPSFLPKSKWTIGNPLFKTLCKNSWTATMKVMVSKRAFMVFPYSPEYNINFFRKDFGMGWNVGWIFNGNIHPFSKLRKQQSGRYWKRTTPNSSENWKIVWMAFC